MPERVCLVGLDPPEVADLRRHCAAEFVAHEMLPRIKIVGGELLVESPEGYHFSPVSRLVFHGIFEGDLNFLSALALWGGPCFPEPLPLIDCRLRLPCLARALKYTRFGGPRDYAGPGVEYAADGERVAKWGDWHCGENKERFNGRWRHREAAVVEPFVEGEAVRVVLIGGHAWQIRMAGGGWKKSVHDDGAALMELDAELADDTRAVRDGFGLRLVANDYIVTANGEKYLLEVNHIPSVTCVPELWAAYRDEVTAWLSESRQ